MKILIKLSILSFLMTSFSAYAEVRIGNVISTRVISTGNCECGNSLQPRVSGSCSNNNSDGCNNNSCKVSNDGQIVNGLCSRNRTLEVVTSENVESTSPSLGEGSSIPLSKESY